jgi:hypothetical protein
MNEPHGEKTHEDKVHGLPGTGSPAEEGSPPELDARILAAACRAVAEHPHAGLADRLLRLADDGRHLLIGFTVGLIVGQLLAGAWRVPRPLESPSALPVAGLAPDEETIPEALPAPECWLDAIAMLVRAGRLDDAQAEIAAFKQ